MARKNFIIHIIGLRQAIDHELILDKLYRVIKLVQEAWLKPYIDNNTKLRAKPKNDFRGNSSS